MFGLVLWRFKILRIIKENAYLKKNSPLQQRAHKIGSSSSATPMLVYIFV